MPVTRSPRGSPTGSKQNQRKEQDASPEELKKQLQELRNAASEKDKEKAKEEADRKKVRANAKKKCAKDIQVVKGDVKKAESKVKKLSQGLSRIQKLEEQNSSKRKQLNDKIDEVLRQAHGKKQVLESELAEARAESSESKMLLSYLEKMQGQISDFGLPLSSEFGISLSSILTSPTGSPTTSPPSSPPPEGAARSNGKVKGTSKDEVDVADRTATINTSMLSDGEDSATSSGTPQLEDATERALRKSLVALDASFHDLEDSAPQRGSDKASKDRELFAQFLELQRLENKQERQIQSLEVAEAASEHEVAILRQRVMDTEAASEHEVAMLLRRITDREASEEAMVEARVAGLRLESVLASAASGVTSQGFGTVPGTDIDRAAITQLCDELRQQEVASVADVSELRSLAWRAEGEAELMTGRVQEQRERELRHELQAADSRARKLHGRLQQQTDEAEEFSRTKANLNAEEAHSQHLRQELGESRAEVARFREADRKSRAVHRSTANELQAASTRSQELQERLDEHHAEIAELQAEAKQTQKVSDLQFALNACEEELAELLKQTRHSEEIYASTELGSHAPLPQAPRSPPLPGIGSEGFGGRFDQPSMHADQQRSLTMFGANGNEILDQPCGHAIQQRSPQLPGIGCEGFGGRFDQPSMHADQQRSLTMFGANGNEILDQPCGHAIQQRSPTPPGIGCEGFGGRFNQPSVHAGRQKSHTMFGANGNEVLDQPCGHAIQQRSPPLPGIGCEGLGRFDQPSMHAGQQRSHTMFGANGNEILDQPCGHAIQQRSPPLPGIGCEGFGGCFDQPSMHPGQQRSLTMFGANGNEIFDQHCGHAIQQRSPLLPGIGCEGLGGCVDPPSMHADQQRSLTMLGANGNEVLDQPCGHAVQQRSPPLLGIGCGGLGARLDQPSMHAGQQRSLTMFGAKGNEKGGGLDQPCGHAIQQRNPAVPGHSTPGAVGQFDQLVATGGQQRNPVRVAGGHQVGPNEHADQQRTKFHTMALNSGLDQPVLVQTGTRNGALDTTSLLSGTSGPAASTSAYPEMRALVHEAEAAAQGLRSTLRQRSEEVAQVKLQLRQRSQRVAQLRAGFTAGSHSASQLPYPLSEASITSPVRAEDSVLQLRAGLAGLSTASFPSASPQAARGSALEALPNFPLTSSSTTWEPNLVPSISSPGLDAAKNTWALHDLQEPIAVQAPLEGNPTGSEKMASTSTASRSVGLQPDADTPPASPSLRSSGLCTPPRRPMVE